MIDLLMVIGGLFGLYLGGEWLVRGAKRVALAFSVSPLIIGLTIVALGTSAPELLVSVQAALRGSSGIALGNVVGSNIANIGLILGMAGLVTPIAVKAILVKREIPIMIFATLFASLLILDGRLSRVDGLLLLFGFIAFNVLFYFLARQEAEANEARMEAAGIEDPGDDVKLPLEFGFILIGCIALVIGSNFLVTGATNIARNLGVSELIIGVTMVAFGTSLPELAASLSAAFEGQSDIAVGNVIGSNIANLLLVLGSTAFILPFDISGELSVVEFVVMIGFAVLLVPFSRNRVLSRFESALFLGAYIAFILYSFFS